MKQEVTCIVCPKGCRLLVDGGEALEVSGAGCPRGIAYGKKEVTSPTRVLTSTVHLQDGPYSRLPVKTKTDIPKHLIKEAMALLNGVHVKAPVITGDVIVKDICGTGIPWIATRTFQKKEA